MSSCFPTDNQSSSSIEPLLNDTLVPQYLSTNRYYVYLLNSFILRVLYSLNSWLYTLVQDTMFVMFINCPYSVVDIEFNVSIVGCIYIA